MVASPLSQTGGPELWKLPKEMGRKSRNASLTRFFPTHSLSSVEGAIGGGWKCREGEASVAGSNTPSRRAESEATEQRPSKGKDGGAHRAHGEQKWLPLKAEEIVCLFLLHICV